VKESRVEKSEIGAEFTETHRNAGKNHFCARQKRTSMVADASGKSKPRAMRWRYARLDAYLLREGLGAWVAVTVVLLAIMLATRFARFLAQAAAGSLPREFLLNVVLLSSLQYLVILIPVSLLLAIMLALGRMYRDQEIAAMTGCGVGPWTLYRPFLVLAVSLAAVNGALSFQFGPWAGREADMMFKQAQRLIQFTPFEPGRADYEIVKFDTLTMRVSPPSMPYMSSKRKIRETSQLLGSEDAEDQAELQWRIAAPLSVLLLALMAVPLSHTSPREGRYGKLVLGIVAYLIYSNLLALGQAWLAKGFVPAGLGLWWVHGIAAMLAFWLIARQLGWRLGRARPDARR
jgi:lipopolysaccharide export LptBFGC system permease protein LptF